jgi:hypothetical protein
VSKETKYHTRYVAFRRNSWIEIFNPPARPTARFARFRTNSQTLRAARIAEASTATDPLTALILETIETTTRAAEKQAADIKDLSMKVSVLSAGGITAPVAYTNNGQPVTNAVRPA